MIYFYKASEDYRFLSNFYHSDIRIANLICRNAEALFQACKFTDKALAISIATQRHPGAAKAMGNVRHVSFRRDWDKMRNVVMMDVLYMKFCQNARLAHLLLQTGDQMLIEHTKNDNYWGDGGDGTGQNMLGSCLGLVRDYIRANGVDWTPIWVTPSMFTLDF